MLRIPLKWNVYCKGGRVTGLFTYYRESRDPCRLNNARAKRCLTGEITKLRFSFLRQKGNTHTKSELKRWV